MIFKKIHNKHYQHYKIDFFKKKIDFFLKKSQTNAPLIAFQESIFLKLRNLSVGTSYFKKIDFYDCKQTQNSFIFFSKSIQKNL